jgi:DNA transformation protein and related proteins
LDKTGIEDLFSSIGRVSLRRMFGGAGLYLNGLCIALVYEGMIWLKTDDTSRPAFESAGSRPFVYEKKSGGVSVMSFWLIPEICFEDEDALKRYVSMAESAALRAIKGKMDKTKA